MTELRIPLRDGVKLGADLYRPAGDAACPVLLIRTPYGKGGSEHEFIAGALERGYAVVVSDVRGRYSSEGDFDAYRHEGLDGYDTIEWVAAQPWSNGRVATAGLSYPGAVQWLAAVEAPPHLVCAFPAMCFSSARQFFYFGGAWDMSWLPWTVENIAPEDRRRRGVTTGPQSTRDARQWWREHGREALARVPLRDQPALAGIAPFYFDWLDHPDDGSYWHFADLESRHSQVRVPIFNFSGWHDEGYGPTGAVRNFTGLRDRAATPDARSPRLMIGPWVSTSIYDIETIDVGIKAILTHTLPTGSVFLPSATIATATESGRGTGTISGLVFADWNADGIQDAGENTIEGIPLRLGGGHTTSGRDGQFAFMNVPAGVRAVGLDTSALPVDFDPPSVSQVQVELSRGDAKRVTFGLIPLGVVQGRVVRDTNGNGKADLNEETVNDAVIILDGGVRSEQVRKGRYRFDAVRSGTHMVKLLIESLPDGAVIAGDPEVQTTLSRDALAAEVIFVVSVEKRPEIRRVLPPRGGAANTATSPRVVSGRGARPATPVAPKSADATPPAPQLPIPAASGNGASGGRGTPTS